MNSFFVLVLTTVPQFTVQFTDRILTTNGSQGVFDVPTTRTLEAGRTVSPRGDLLLRGGEESDNVYPLPVLSISGFHRRSSAPPPVLFLLLNFFDQFLCQRTKRRLFLKILNPIVFTSYCLYLALCPVSLGGDLATPV